MGENYFSNIDTVEKAYILGLVNKNNNFLIALNINPYILSILKMFCENIENTLTISITDENILNNIKNSTYNFNDFSRDLKIAFIRGIYESNFDKIPINDFIKPILNSILDFINIKHEIIDNYIVYKKEMSYIKFNKLIYDNNDITLLNSFVKGEILYKINNANPKIKVYKTDKNAVIPSKGYEEDVGLDLTIISKIKDFNSKTTLYDTGIKIEVDEGYYTEIVPRSSISKFGYILSNNIGIIDNNYRGNLMVSLTKISDDAPEIVLPFKCCQLIIRKQIFPEIYEIEDNNLSSTTRNEGGFGSTS
jgi:deoxyuridine 5'-triphosphate nucleotidohydrolase